MAATCASRSAAATPGHNGAAQHHPAPRHARLRARPRRDRQAAAGLPRRAAPTTFSRTSTPSSAPSCRTSIERARSTRVRSTSSTTGLAPAMNAINTQEHSRQGPVGAVAPWLVCAALASVLCPATPRSWAISSHGPASASRGRAQEEPTSDRIDIERPGAPAEPLPERRNTRRSTSCAPTSTPTRPRRSRRASPRSSSARTASSSRSRPGAAASSRTPSASSARASTST